MADIRSVEGTRREPADGDHAPAEREPLREDGAPSDLGARRHAVRRRGAGMRRHDVPEQHVLVELELGQDAMDDRRGRLRRALSGQLALGREGDPRDARTAVPRRLPDEKDRRAEREAR